MVSRRTSSVVSRPSDRLELGVVGEPQPGTRLLAVLPRRATHRIHEHGDAGGQRLDHGEGERLERRRGHERLRAPQQAHLVSSSIMPGHDDVVVRLGRVDDLPTKTRRSGPGWRRL